MLFHFKYLVNVFASVNLRTKMRVADVWSLDWAEDCDVSFSWLVSLAFISTRWAGPVVDDQGNADQGKQDPQAQEKGSLEQQKGTGYFQWGKHFSHAPGKSIKMLSPPFVRSCIWSLLKPLLNCKNLSEIVWIWFSKDGNIRTNYAEPSLFFNFMVT